MRMKSMLLSNSLLLLTVSSVLAADPQWTRKSSVTGDLPVPCEGDQQTCCVVADFDDDGIDDFAIGERTKTPSIVWYKYNGKGWDKRVIDDTHLRPEAGGISFDIDGDGDNDLIFGNDGSGTEIWWWENPAPDFSKPWTRRRIKKDGARKHHDQTAGDFDGDGRLEFVTWNQRAGQLLMYDIPENPRSSKLWSAQVIYSWSEGAEHEGFPSIPVDVDLDGQIDIVGGGRWFKRTADGQFEVNVIDNEKRFTQCAAGQLVKGGHPEIVFSPGDVNGHVEWYEWKDGQWVAHDLGYVVHGHTCEMRDIDGDGNQDLMVGEMGKPGAGDDAKTYVWYGDGSGQFRKTVVSHGQGIHEGLLADLDGDGDLDILFKPYNHNAPRLDILLQK